jgi:hypothetical protein
VIGAIMRFGEDAVARILYDQNREAWDGILESAGGGGIAGAVVGACRAFFHLPPAPVGAGERSAVSPVEVDRIAAALARLAPETRARVAAMPELSRTRLRNEQELLAALSAENVNADSRTVRQQVLDEARKMAGRPTVPQGVPVEPPKPGPEPVPAPNVPPTAAPEAPGLRPAVAQGPVRVEPQPVAAKAVEAPAVPPAPVPAPTPTEVPPAVPEKATKRLTRSPSLKEARAAANEFGLMPAKVQRFLQFLRRPGMTVEQAADLTSVRPEVAAVLAERFKPEGGKTYKEIVKEGEKRLTEAVAGVPKVGKRLKKAVPTPPPAETAPSAPEVGQVRQPAAAGKGFAIGQEVTSIEHPERGTGTVTRVATATPASPDLYQVTWRDKKKGWLRSAEMRQAPAPEGNQPWEKFYAILRHPSDGKFRIVDKRNPPDFPWEKARPFDTPEQAIASVEANWQHWEKTRAQSVQEQAREAERDRRLSKRLAKGAVGTYVREHDLDLAENAGEVEAGEGIGRVVWEDPGNTIETNEPSAVGLPGSKDVRAIHVTSDEDYWIRRLAEDYGRDRKNAKRLTIRLAQGDILADDVQYMTDPDTGLKADSAILLTTRKTLRRGVDFVVGDEPWADAALAKLGRPGGERGGRPPVSPVTQPAKAVAPGEPGYVTPGLGHEVELIRRWKGAGTVGQQAARLARGLRAAGVTFQRENAGTGSVYFRVELPEGESLSLRVADHAQPEHGGVRWSPALGMATRKGAADFSADPETGQTWRDLLKTAIERNAPASLASRAPESAVNIEGVPRGAEPSSRQAEAGVNLPESPGPRQLESAAPAAVPPAEAVAPERPTRARAVKDEADALEVRRKAALANTRDAETPWGTKYLADRPREWLVLPENQRRLTIEEDYAAEAKALAGEAAPTKRLQRKVPQEPVAAETAGVPAEQALIPLQRPPTLTDWRTAKPGTIVRTDFANYEVLRRRIRPNQEAQRLAREVGGELWIDGPDNWAVVRKIPKEGQVVAPAPTPTRAEPARDLLGKPVFESRTGEQRALGFEEPPVEGHPEAPRGAVAEPDEYGLTAYDYEQAERILSGGKWKPRPAETIGVRAWLAGKAKPSGHEVLGVGLLPADVADAAGAWTTAEKTAGPKDRELRAWNESRTTMEGETGATLLDEIEAAKARAKKSMGGGATPVGLGPVSDVVDLGYLYIKKGVRDFATWAKQMVTDLGQRVRAYLPKVWARAMRFWREETGQTLPREPGEEPAGEPTPEEVEAELQAEAEAALERQGELVEPPLAEKPMGEPYADAASAGKRVLNLLRSFKAADLPKMVDRLNAAGERDLKTVPEVAKALADLREATKYRKSVEAEAKPLIAEAPTRAYTPLLDWLGEKIDARAGADMATEIKEALAGRPYLRKFFDFTGKTRPRPIDGVMSEAMESADSGFKGDDTSAFLDQMVKEADALEAQRAIGGDVGQQLRAMAEGSRDPGEVRALAERVDRAVARENEMQRAVVESLEPHIMVRRVENIARLEAQLHEAKAAIETETAKARQEERAASEAKLQQVLAAAHEQIRIFQVHAKMTAGARIMGAEARAAAFQKLRKEFKAAVQALPPAVRGKLWRFSEGIERPEQLTLGIDRAQRLLGEELKRGAYETALRTAKVIHNHRMEFDPQADAEALVEAEKVLAGGATAFKGVSVEEMREISNRLLETWHVHQNAKTLYTLQGMANAEDAARSVLKDLADWKPAAGVEERGPAPGTPHRSMPNRVVDLNSYPDSLIEGHLGPEDGVLERVLVSNVGTNVAHHFSADWYAIWDPMNEACKVATGGTLRKEAAFRWFSAPLTFEIGGVKVRAEREQWMTLRAVLKDADATGKWLKNTESDNPEPSTAVWSNRRGKVALAFNNMAEVQAFTDAFDAAEPKAAAYIDSCLAATNDPARFEKSNATHFRLFGMYLEKVPGTRMATEYNVAAEKQRAVPDFSTASPADILKHLRQHFARLPGGRGISMVIGRFNNVLLREAWEDAAFNTYAPGLRDGWTLLQQMVEHGAGEKEITLKAYLGERVGQEVPRTLDSHLKSIAKYYGLSYQARLEEADIDPVARRLLYNAMGAAVALKWTPIANQIPAVLLPCADTKPMTLRDLLAGIIEFASRAGWAWQKLKRLRSDIRFRAELTNPEDFIAASESAPRGYGPNRVWRTIKRAVRYSGRGMIRVDQANRILHYLAARHQLIREGNLSGEPLEQKAADMAARWMYRVDAPLHPAYATPVGRAARTSTLIAAVTPFTKGKLANFQVVLRAINDYARDGDAKKLAYKLSIAGIVAAGFTAIGVGGAYFAGRKVGEGLGGVPGDFVENALGNVYGATEAIRLIRSKSPYGVQVFSSPPVAAAERVGRGLVGLRVAIEKGGTDKALAAASKILRGSAALAGIPTDQAVNLIRFGRRIGAPGHQLAQWPGLRMTPAVRLMADILGPRIPSPPEPKRLMKGAKPRKRLRRRPERGDVAMFRRLTYQEAQRVYRLADADEKRLWGSILASKVRSGR